MMARRHPNADDSTPDAHVTNRTCLSRRWCGWLKWSVMLTVIGGLAIAAGWLFLIVDGAKGMAHALDVRVQAEETKSSYVERDIREMKDSLKSIDTEIKAIRADQATYFARGKK